MAFYSRQTEFHREFACFLFAFLVTRRMVGIPAVATADAREFAGRLFGVTIFGWALILARIDTLF